MQLEDVLISPNKRSLETQKSTCFIFFLVRQNRLYIRVHLTMALLASQPQEVSRIHHFIWSDPIVNGTGQYQRPENCSFSAVGSNGYAHEDVDIIIELAHLILKVPGLRRIYKWTIIHHQSRVAIYFRNLYSGSVPHISDTIGSRLSPMIISLAPIFTRDVKRFADPETIRPFLVLHTISPTRPTLNSPEVSVSQSLAQRVTHLDDSLREALPQTILRWCVSLRNALANLTGTKTFFISSLSKHRYLHKGLSAPGSWP